MSIRVWYGAGAAGLLAATLASCAHERKPTAERPPPAAAQPAPQAAQQPPQPRDQLAEAEKRLEDARRDVATAQQQLAAAQQREERERASVQQLEIKARQDLDRATQLALQAEQAQGLEAATGRIAQATPSHVLLQLQDGRTMSFQVDHRTRVIVGSEQRSVSDIQQGADARVAYDPRGDEKRAMTIRIAPVASGLGATPRRPASPSGTEASPQR